MRIAYFWITEQGYDVVTKLKQALKGDIFGKRDFKSHVYRAFTEYDALVFVMATGIVVRTIAPLLQSKATDPAVIVIDQQGQYVISLLSGHLGGANALTRKIASILHAAPVITTATDAQGVVAFDEVAKKNGLVIENLPVLKWISGALLSGKTICLHSILPIDDVVLPKGISLTDGFNISYHVVISDRITEKADNKKTLFLRPKSLVVGIGCKRHMDPMQMEKCFQEFLARYQLSPLSLCGFATIPFKQEEPSILQLCQKYSVPLLVVSTEEIQACSHLFDRSAFVESITGVPSVAQACSYLASGKGQMLSGKVTFPGITFSVCRKALPSLKLGE